MVASMLSVTPLAGLESGFVASATILSAGHCPAIATGMASPAINVTATAIKGLNILVSTVVGDGRLSLTALRIAGFSAQWKYPLASKFIATSYRESPTR